VENNPKQRNYQKQLGGITGRGFLPGKSGNPNGRPHTRGLVAALRLKIAEIAPDGRTLEEHLIDVLMQEAFRGKHRLPAVELIFDRLEGRAPQTLEVADITRELREKSDEELKFYLEHTRWPTAEELRLLTEGKEPPSV
jgi:hypothetical protein